MSNYLMSRRNKEAVKPTPPKTWVKKVKYNKEDNSHYIEIEDVAKEMKWLPGDILEWVVENNQVILRKREKEV